MVSNGRSWAAFGMVLLSLPGSTLATGIESMRWLNPTPQGNAIRSIDFESPSIGYAVGLYGTILRTTDAGSSWQDLSEPLLFGKHLYDVVAVGDGELWAVGDEGVYRSTDGATTWRPVSSPAATTLHQLEIVGSLWSVVGEEGERIVSTDSGMHWTLAPNTGVVRARDQAWIDAQHGFVVGMWNVVATSDGGLTWTELDFPAGEYTEVRFENATDGWLSSSFSIHRTTDGGQTWIPSGFGPPGPLYVAEQVIYSEDHRLAICDGEGAEVWETTDGGGNWTQIYMRGATVGYTDIAELPNGRLVMASTDGDLLHSEDQGHTWTNTTRSPGDEDRIDLYHVRHLANGGGFGVGNSAEWLRTQDGGESWQREPTPQGAIPYELEFWEDGLLGITMAVGDGAFVSKTTDGGDTWSPRMVSSNFLGAIAGIAFVKEHTVYLAYTGSGPERVFRSTDAGDTWEPRSHGIPPNAETIRCISFVDESVGYIAGGFFDATGSIMKTTDGGSCWTTLPSPNTEFTNVWDMHWLSADHGFVGCRFTVFETTDGGSSWTPALSEPCWRISWDGDERGCIVWFGSNVLQITLDGGASWTAVEVPVASYLLDARWASEDKIWIASFGSRIVEVTLLSPSDVPSGAVASTEVLRVFPHPVHDRVRVEFSSARAGDASMVWFDAVGRRVAERSAAISEGPNSLDWTAPHASGSVLFLRVELPDGRFLIRKVVTVR